MLKKIRFLLVSNLQSLTDSRGDMLIYTATSFVLPFILMNIWLTIFDKPGQTEMNKEYIVSYYLLLMLVNVVTGAWHGTFMADKIREGEISRYILQPFPYIWHEITENISEKILKLFFAVIPLFFIFFLYRNYVHIPIIQTLPLFLVSGLTGAGIAFLIHHLIGISGFWISENAALKSYNDTISYVASGKFAPLPFITKFLPVVLIDILPYKYITYFPISVGLGTLSQVQLIYGFGSQFLWIITLSYANHFLWQRGLKAYGGYGG